MTLAELLDALDDRGVTLGVRLTIDAPKYAITDDVREALAEHRGSILSRLGKDAEWEQLASQRWGATDDDPEAEAAAERAALQDPSTH